MKSTSQMQFNWMDVFGPGVSCTDVHPDTSCLFEFFTKISLVSQKSAKFYLILHLIPFIIFRAKKIKDRQKLKEAILKFAKTYFGSLMFMATLVAGNKSVLCFNNYICGNQQNFDGKVFWWGSFFGSLSIFFQDGSRRQEIAYFVLVRALRSLYVALKRRNWFTVPKEEKTAFIVIFGMMSYIFSEHSNLLKHKNIYEKLWGIS